MGNKIVDNIFSKKVFYPATALLSLYIGYKVCNSDCFKNAKSMHFGLKNFFLKIS